MKIKTLMLIALTSCIAFGCKKMDRQNGIDDPSKNPPYDKLPEDRKPYAFYAKEFKLKSILKNGQDATSSFPKSQLDNSFFFNSTERVAYDYGKENISVEFPKKGNPTRYAQPALYQRKANGIAYMTLTHYLIDSGEPGPIEFEIKKFVPGELILRRTENGAIIDRVFSVSEEMRNKPDIYDSWSEINNPKPSI